jgi:NAD(P)-dependent dehydrogenase (short-subunit alcohol dehydrogenase family)
MSEAQSRQFGGNSTTADVTEGIDLAGQVAVVTGASTGLGAETARALAAKGAHVTLAVRNLEKGEGVAAEIRSSTGNSQVDVGEIELSVPASVRAFAKTYLAGHPKLNLLINNAGIMGCPLERTTEGWELQFATNHLGHFLLTCLLVPGLRAGAPSRVVNLSSAGHRFSPVIFDDIHFERREYDKWASYGQAKTANILFSSELNRRLSEGGVTANAVHSGGIMTELGRHLQQADIEELMSRAPSGGIQWKSVESGAATSVWAATAPELEGRGGLYLEDCGVGALHNSEDSSTGYQAHVFDTEAASRLWSISEELLGERFDFN